jgi:hypothetical protein
MCDYLWRESSAQSLDSQIENGQGVHMFDGKNNRILDSFSFRVAVTAAVFAAWSAAGYALLYLA